jgi:ABC-type polysaccharide/polyol phosphate export permease
MGRVSYPNSLGGQSAKAEMIPFRAMSATNEAPAAFRHAAGDAGALGLIREAIGDIRSRRRLVRYLVVADMRKHGADTLLGNFWWVLDPLLQMLVYWVFVSIIVTRDIPNYPLFIFCAILPWKWFSASASDATSSVTSQDRLIKQIQFPKIVLPVSATVAGVVGFAFGLIPLGMLMLFSVERISAYLLLIPVIAAVQFVFTLAFALLVSSVNVFFRDLGNVVRHVLRLWFYLSPGLYSLAILDDVPLLQELPWLRALIEANPFAILFEAYRAVIYGTPDGGPPTAPDWASLGLLLIGSTVFLTVATVVFKRLEPNFAKVL